MNSSLETNTEVNLNIFAVTETVTKTVTSTVTKTVTEKLKKTSRETLLENVENVFQNITNLTEESQYNETFVDSDMLLKSADDKNDGEKELNPTWMIIQITFVFVSICALILRSFYTICWEEKQKKIQKKLSRLESARSTRVEMDGIREEEEVFLQPKRVKFDKSTLNKKVKLDRS